MHEAEAAWRAELERRTLADLVGQIPPAYATTVTGVASIR
jgi:hypothetical protein